MIFKVYGCTVQSFNTLIADLTDGVSPGNPVNLNNLFSGAPIVWPYNEIAAMNVATAEFLESLLPDMKSLIRFVTNAHYLAVDETRLQQGINRPYFGYGFGLRYPVKFRIMSEPINPGLFSTLSYANVGSFIDCEIITPFCTDQSESKIQIDGTKRCILKCISPKNRDTPYYATLDFSTTLADEAEANLPY